MYRFYQVIFWIGVFYTGATFALGNFMDFDLDGDFEFEGEIPFFTISPLKPIIIISFITTFGGLGMLGYHLNWSPIKSFAIAIISALIISSILYFAVLIPLARAQRKSEAVKQSDLIGLEAEVINAIVDNGCGKISYIANQNRYTGTARSVDGSRIEQNQPVVIYKIESNVFYVLPLTYKRGM